MPVRLILTSITYLIFFNYSTDFYNDEWESKAQKSTTLIVNHKIQRPVVIINLRINSNLQHWRFLLQHENQLSWDIFVNEWKSRITDKQK